MSTSNNENKVCIGMLVHDHPGVMMKITGMFARRGYNIANITVGHSEREGFSRITIVGEGDEATIEQIIKQLNKLIDVIKVLQLPAESTTMRELALVKVHVKDSKARQEIVSLVEIFRSKTVDVTARTMTIELVGSERKVNSFLELISEICPILEIVRSGTVALGRGEKSITLE